MKNLVKYLFIDAAALVVYLLAAYPSITGLFIHEWVCLGLLVVIIVHCAVHCDWIADKIARMFKRKQLNTQMQVLKLALDALLAIVFVTAIVSGIMVSRYILPLQGLVAPGYFFWKPLHIVSAKVLLTLLLLHVVLQWNLIANIFTNKRGSKDNDKQ